MKKGAPASSMMLTNARFADGELGSLRIVEGHIGAVNGAAHAQDTVIDLQGDRIYPGLINAHDHLQLNSMPRHESAATFRHVRDWITEVDAARRSNPEFEARVAVARDERLILGGIKNLLGGATTVAHHDPLYPLLSDPDFPTQVVQQYGWSHSLYVENDSQVQRSFRATPPNWPWIIHAAEGVDEQAAQEFDRLDALGCVAANSLLVHGIALNESQLARLLQRGAALIWCPTSNTHLFGKTAMVELLIGKGRVALGTDSRLSGARDLLDELRAAAAIIGADEKILERLVCTDAAHLLGLHDRGRLAVGGRADILVLPAEKSLATASRADVRLLLIGGESRYADADFAQHAILAANMAPVRVDGIAKLLLTSIVTRLRSLSGAEPGLDIHHIKWRAA